MSAFNIKRISLLLMVLVCLCSCNNIPKTSVFEPLTSQQLARIIEKDDRFEFFYEDYWYTYGATIVSLDELDKAKYIDLTYRDLYKYYLLGVDEDFNKTIEEEWNSRYGIYTSKADSVINYWTQFKANNSLEKYVKVELDYVYARRGTQECDFALTPLCEGIERVSFVFRYIKGGDYLKSVGGKEYTVTCYDPVDKRRIFEWYNYNYDDYMGEVSNSYFMSSFMTQIEVISVKINGNTYDYSSMPTSVRKYLDERKTIIRNSSVQKYDIIREVLDPQYKTLAQYVVNKKNEMWERECPKVYYYYEYMKNKAGNRLNTIIKQYLQ